MDVLKKKRKVVRSQATRLTKETDDILAAEEAPTIEKVSVLLERLHLVKQQLSDVDAAIEPNIKEDEAEVEFEQVIEYGDKIATCICRLKLKKDQAERASRTQETWNQATISTPSAPQRIKLPKLELTKFDGKRKNWQPFWEQFEVAVHKNTDLSNIDRLNYLKTLLTGEAETAIAGLQASGDCYGDAVDILRQRFGNPEALIQDHMQGLIDVKPVFSARNVRGLRRLYDEIQVHMRGLKALDIEENGYQAMLYPVLLRALPKDLILEYHRTNAEAQETTTPTVGVDSGSTSSSSDTAQVTPLQSLLRFLRFELESRERTLEDRPDDTHGKPVSPFDGNRARRHREHAHPPSASALHGAASCMECVFCSSKGHESQECQSKTVTERKAILTAKGGCFRCTKHGHRSRQCRVKISCKRCKRRHATAMCDPAVDEGENTRSVNEGAQPVSLHASGAGKDPTHRTVLMPTVTALNKGSKSRRVSRVLFDSGSQRTFITEDCSRKLGCRLLGTELLSVGVFGGGQTRRTFRRVEVCLLRRDDQKTHYKIEALETPSICEQVIPCPNEKIRETLRELMLPLGDDSALADGAPIDVLIGSDQYWECVTGRVKKLPNKLTAVETVFGWAVQGEVLSKCKETVCTHAIVMRTTVADRETAPILQMFWDLENIGVSDTATSSSHSHALEVFAKNVKKVDDRYEVRLPWKGEVEMSDNRAVAENRLRYLTKRLSRRPSLMRDYDSEMRRLIDEGIAEKTADDHCHDTQLLYYMPHQPVLRKGSATTKLRIVFDASSHSATTKSLNDNLESGPNLNPDLVRLLLNFRRYEVALVADVEKAFLQIGVAPEDRNALRFLWFAESPIEGRPLPEIESFRMTRIPFGTTSSPFLLAATLQHHLESMKQAFPATTEVLKSCFYVDDLLCGAENEEQGARIYDEASRIFQAASMRLHKWGSNSTKISELFSCQSPSEMPLGQPANLLKVLGLSWQPKEDTLTFSPDSVIEFSKAQRNTKRFVLQTTARLYDPLGFLSPYTVRAKAMFQDIWKENIAWDQPLPDPLRGQWIKWCEELPSLHEIAIPRRYDANAEGRPQGRILHVFADASPKAYGAVVYLCTENAAGETTSAFMLSKCRVAPLKAITLARLELMAALLASRLYQFVRSNVDMKFDKVYLWTDSMITLSWIRGYAARWKEFVKNRVTEIQQNTDTATWRFCPGKANPADLMTRGLTATQLKSSELWWSGPKWITGAAEEWPAEPSPDNFTAEELEQKNEIGVLNSTCDKAHELLDLNKFSSASTVNRITGWIFRFVRNVRANDKTSGPLTAAEIERAEDFWIKNVQKSAFSAELECTIKGRRIPNGSTLKEFTLLRDENGLLRIEGRLCSTNMTLDERHPVVLPKQHRYTTLLVHRAHQQLLHAGARDTLVQLREKYWIVRGRQLVKSVVRSCVVCKRHSGAHFDAATGPLPPDRTTQADPFRVVGLDFAGPLMVKENNRTVKSYIVLFTCGVTRAVHLELAADMSTASFIQAFRRFVSRRGLCRVVYSDNALSFKRASKDMGVLWKLLRHPETQNHFANSGIEWKFIAERAPWWGGFYERLVRSVKSALRKTIGRQCLDTIELSTILAEVEAVINSRPLTYTYEDPKDGAPLTPASFLTGRRLTALPAPETRAIDTSAAALRALWKRRGRTLNLFWQTWQREYLGQLRSAFASKQPKTVTPRVGEVVLLRDNQPRLLWKSGVIADIFPGRDGRVRSCEVRMPQGKTVRRPVQLLYPLELSET